MPGLLCIIDVSWREVGEEPIEGAWEDNQSCPFAGEVRWVYLSGEFLYATGTLIWLMYQSATARSGGWGSVEDIESVALVECVFLEHSGVKQDQYNDSYSYWARVECRRVIRLDEIASVFPEMLPTRRPESMDRPFEGEMEEFGSFIYYWIRKAEQSEWLLTTNTQPERLILWLDSYNSWAPVPAEICNCVFNLDEWPYEVWKKRRRRK